MPIAYAFFAIVLLTSGRMLRRPKIGELAVPLLIAAWFMAITSTAMQFVGSSNSCTFGPSEITYYAEHGRVVGLEDPGWRRRACGSA